MANKPIVYLDACCFIDAVKEAVGELPEDRADDVWHIKKLLEAHQKGLLIVQTSVLTLAECVGTTKGQGNVPQDVQDNFKNLLRNGQYVTLAQPTPRTGEKAQDLRWNDNLVLKGADALHVATAFEIGAVEFLTTDGHLQKLSKAAAALSGRLRIARASDTGYLPDDLKQGGFGFG